MCVQQDLLLSSIEQPRAMAVACIFRISYRTPLTEKLKENYATPVTVTCRAAPNKLLKDSIWSLYKNKLLCGFHKSPYC